MSVKTQSEDFPYLRTITTANASWNDPREEQERKEKIINDRMSAIEAKLAIFSPNPELESRWEILRDLRKQYLAAEQDILEQEEIIRILKR